MGWRKFLYMTPFAAIVIAPVAVAQERFDYAVRDEMFRAFGGNEAAYKSAMSTIEEKLREQPDHAAGHSMRATLSAVKPWRGPRWRT
jgi:hypothetical protein